MGKSAENETHFIVKRGDDRVTFESDDCEEIMKVWPTVTQMQTNTDSDILGDTCC